MTGRDLIIYILSNNLENEEVIKDGKLMGWTAVGEVAAKMNVGVATVLVWIAQQHINTITIGDTLYVPADFDKHYD